MTSLAKRVSNDIIERLKNNDLIMPTLPEVALQVREVAQDPFSSLSDLTHIIARDPALSARLIKISNSPLMRAANPASDIQAAVTRLGVTHTSNLATGLAMEQMFQATSEMIDKRLRHCWTHSLEIAASVQVLAQHFTKLPSDQAMLAGLTHQIGMLPILAFAEEHHELLADGISLDMVLDTLHCTLGAYILREWKFSAEVVRAALEYRKWDRQVAAPDLCDLVQVATLQSYADSNHPLSKIDRNQVGAFARLGLASDNAQQWQELEEQVIIMEAVLQ